MAFGNQGGVGFQRPSIIIANQVIVEGSDDGVFVYNGTPSLGNPPILSVVSPGTTEDPYGNTVTSVLVIGDYGANSIQFDSQGDVLVHGPDGLRRIAIWAGGSDSPNSDPAIWFYNDFGAVVLVVDPQAGGVFTYFDNGDATQGGLTGAQISKNTTDPVLNISLSAGVNVIDPVFGDSLGIVGAHVLINNVPWNTSGEIAASGGTPTGNVGPAVLFIAPTVTGAPGIVVLGVFGESANTDVAAGLVLSTSSPPVKATSAILEAQGTFALEDESAPTKVSGYAQPFANSGILGFVSGNDGQTYDTGTVTRYTAGQAVSSTAPAAVVWGSGNNPLIAAGTYHVYGKMICTMGATSAAGEFTFTSTGAVSAMRVSFHAIENVSILVSNEITAIGSSMATGTIPNGTAGQFFFDGIIEFSAAGNLGLEVAEGTTGDAWTLNSQSWMAVEPVVA
jgi:hypothetical protein